MAELDPSIIFRQEKYSGPTQDELDAKQDMNALRNMLGAGRAIDSPEVINAMMARSPDMGLKLQSNASTMQTNAAAAQKSIADARAKDREARIAELDALLPVGSAIVQRGDQQAWSEFRTFLGQKFPEALMGYPDNVAEGGKFLQDYITARQQMASKGGSTTPFRRGAPVPTDRGYITLNEAGQAEELRDPSGRTYMPLPRGDGGGGNPETYGGSVEYMINEETGEVRPLLRGDRGTIRAGELPKGFKPVLPSVMVNQGTEESLVDKVTGKVRATFDKRLAEAESLKAQGKVLGDMYAASKDAVQTGEHISKQIDALIKDPQREAGTGWSSFFNVIPTSEGKSYQLKVDQLGGQAFLQAFNSLKGGGAITETEGNKATAAIARLNTTLSEKDFIEALTDFKNVVEEITERRRKENQGAIPGLRAGQPAAGAATPAPAGAGAPGAAPAPGNYIWNGTDMVPAP